jgi:hypothetical protein
MQIMKRKMSLTTYDRVCYIEHQNDIIAITIDLIRKVGRENSGRDACMGLKELSVEQKWNIVVCNIACTQEHPQIFFGFSR